MNALLVSVIKNKEILIANEGRLLKKCFLGILVLFLLILSNNFSEIIKNSLIEAYLQVSVFVGFTLFIFLGIDFFTKFEIKIFLKRTKKFHVLIASFLGSLPGCGGAIIIVTQYIQGKISFGSLVAVLTSTMGDAAFLLLAKEPSKGFLVFLITLFSGIFTGYLVDLFHKENYLKNKKNLKIEYEKVKKTFVSNFNLIWILVFIPGFISGFLLMLQINIDEFISFNENFSLKNTIGFWGAIISIFMWTLNPLSDFQCSTEKSRSYISRIIDTTNFVTTWVFIGFLFFEFIIFFTSIDLKSLFDVWVPLTPIIAILFGFIPGCGPQILVTTFYLNGYIPFSAELGNAISNDGDALFPAIALVPKAAIIATLYSAFPAIIVAYLYMFLVEL